MSWKAIAAVVGAGVVYVLVKGPKKIIEETGGAMREAAKQVYKATKGYIDTVALSIYDAGEIILLMMKESGEQELYKSQLRPAILNWETGSGGIASIKDKIENRDPPYVTTMELAVLIRYKAAVSDPTVKDLGYHDPGMLAVASSIVDLAKNGTIRVVHTMDMVLYDLIKKEEKGELTPDDIMWIEQKIKSTESYIAHGTYERNKFNLFSKNGLKIAKDLLLY